MTHHDITTWQEGDTWYAAPEPYHPDAPVGDADCEEYAILNLRHQIEDLNRSRLDAWEARNDEP
jgi:hypothetical protein